MSRLDVEDSILGFELRNLKIFSPTEIVSHQTCSNLALPKSSNPIRKLVLVFLEVLPKLFSCP